MANVPESDKELFDSSKHIPSGSDVIERVKRDSGKNAVNTTRPRPAIFREHGVLVKWGAMVTIAEGQWLWYLNRVRSAHGDKVPTPKIYGWYKYPKTKIGKVWASHEPWVHLVMEYIPSVTLHDRWSTLNPDQKGLVCEQLQGIWKTIRSIPPSPQARQCAVCHVNGGPVSDVILQDSRVRLGSSFTAGPFKTVHNFNVAFAGLIRGKIRGEDSDRTQVERGEHELESNPNLNALHSAGADTCLSLCDFNFGNVLMSEDSGKPTKVLAIIDWGQAAIMPAYWEWCKAVRASLPQNVVEGGYFAQILGPAEATEEAFNAVYDTLKLH